MKKLLLIVAMSTISLVSKGQDFKFKLMDIPLTDKEEVAQKQHSDSIISVAFIGYSPKSLVDYTIETYKDGHQEVVAIPVDLFPHWVNADNTIGFKVRCTDAWVKVAIKH